MGVKKYTHEDKELSGLFTAIDVFESFNDAQRARTFEYLISRYPKDYDAQRKRRSIERMKWIIIGNLKDYYQDAYY